MSFDSSRKTQEQAASARSTTQSGKRSSARVKRSLRASIEEYILDHRSQNHSPKTIEWHTLALGNLAAFLEKKGVTFIEDIERVHILSWLTNMSPNLVQREKAVGTFGQLLRSLELSPVW